MFINLTAHDLLPEQINIAEQSFGNVIQNPPELEEIRQLLKNNCPDNKLGCIRMAKRLTETLNAIAQTAGEDVWVHVPIGSPFFMAEFVRWSDRTAKFYLVFSHSDRVSEDQKQQDGTVKKVSSFKFKKFNVL